MTKSVSAVIRTWNSDRTLERTLASLREQDPPINEYIVVDSGSTDKTLEIARQFGARIIAYPKDRDFNYSRALNIGISEARSDYILSISSHVVLLYQDIVRLMSSHLDQFDAAGAYCTFRSCEEERTQRTEPYRQELVTLIQKGNFNGHNGLWNSCSLIAKSAWRDHHFMEDMPRAEDQEWAHWHYHNSKKPTVRMKDPGVLYLNPHRGYKKDALDYAVIAHRLMPEMASWRAIMRLTLNALNARLLGRTHEARHKALCAWETARAHFSTRHWNARAHLRRQSGSQPN